MPRMTNLDKANKIDFALRRLRSELGDERQQSQRDAISEFLVKAPIETRARLYELIIRP